MLSPAYRCLAEVYKECQSYQIVDKEIDLIMCSVPPVVKFKAELLIGHDTIFVDIRTLPLLVSRHRKASCSMSFAA